MEPEEPKKPEDLDKWKKKPKEPKEPMDPSLFEGMLPDDQWRLDTDLLLAAKTLSADEVRYIVDSYYVMQDNRKRAASQARSMVKAAKKDEKPVEPHLLLDWFFARSDKLEKQIRKAMAVYAGNSPIGQWAMQIIGIGPVISSGLLANIDIEKAPTVGHIWRYAGQDPTSKWEKGQRRPWNASLKRLCWIIGDCFFKTKGHPYSYYGPIYEARKAYEERRNEAGELKDQAEAILVKKKIRKTTIAYQSYIIGKLPAKHIHQRAARYTTKLFLAHLHHVWYKHAFGKEPPVPYPIAMLEGHTHIVNPPPVPEPPRLSVPMNESAKPSGMSEPSKRSAKPKGLSAPIMMSVKPPPIRAPKAMSGKPSELRAPIRGSGKPRCIRAPKSESAAISNKRTRGQERSQYQG